MICPRCEKACDDSFSRCPHCHHKIEAEGLSTETGVKKQVDETTRDSKTAANIERTAQSASEHVLGTIPSIPDQQQGIREATPDFEEESNTAKESMKETLTKPRPNLKFKIEAGFMLVMFLLAVVIGINWLVQKGKKPERTVVGQFESRLWGNAGMVP